MNVTFKISGEEVTGRLIKRHEDYAVPLTEISWDGNRRTAMLKDSEFARVVDPTIVRVNFTFAIVGGMWIERANGDRSWEAFATIEREVGKTESDRLYRIAYASGMCGMWYDAN